MRIWKHSWLDVFLLMFSVAQVAITIPLALYWYGFSFYGKVGSFFILTFMMSYNIIVVSHLFTHAPWFNLPLLNKWVSILNSINIGQSVQAYHLSHVRNHHRYNNDAADLSGKTQDFSSTYQGGKNGEHVGIFKYAFRGAAESLINIGRNDILALYRLWKIGNHECDLLALASKSTERRSNELHQVRLDRAAHFFAIAFLLFISWKWVLLCYLPAFYLALALVNVQNYYEHFGAVPDNKFANSVSYYGCIYNFFAFNDGYHQEHHLRPGEHWTAMTKVRQTYRNELDSTERVISPVPASIGFLHFKRILLHRLVRSHLEKKPHLDFIG